MAGLSALFRRNPYRDQMTTTAGMIDRSGYAKPFMMKALGEQTRQAGEYDEESASTLADLYQKDTERKGDESLRDDADKVIKSAADLAKQDPIAATQYYNDRAKGNKHLPQGLTFRRSLDGKSLMEIKDKKGSIRGVINATDMFLEADELEKRSGKPLDEAMRKELAEKYFYPVPGYEKPDDEEGTHKKGDVREFFKKGPKGEALKGKEEYQGKEKGWVPLGDFVSAHAPKDGDGEGGEGGVKPTASKALKVEVARKLATQAIRELEAKRTAGTPKELRAVKAIKDALSNIDPLTKDLNPDSIYTALPQEYQGAFDEILLSAEDAFPRTRKVSRAVHDAFTTYHKKKGATPAAPAAGGSDWRKYLKKPGK